MMMAATHPYIPRISIVCDFDSTLATDTLDAVVEEMGLSRDEFRQRFVEPLGDGWDDITRRGYALILAGRELGRPVSPALFRDAAERVELFEGVLELPSCLVEVAQEVDPDIEVELIVLSSGYAEVIKATGIGEAFAPIWAGTFAYHEGEAVAVKRIITHPEKALYLEAHAKGIEVDGSNGPERAGAPVADEDMHTPYDQMGYLGDGLSDLNAFRFLTNAGGLCIAIDKKERFEHEESMSEDQKVDNVAPPSYVEGSQLFESLVHVVRGAASRIALRKLSRQA